MKTWNDYKATYRADADIFDFARQGDLRSFANMLSNNRTIDVNVQNHRGYSALMLAVYNGEKDFCETLLRCGAMSNSTDFSGNTVLMAAAFKGNVDIFKLLLTFGATLTLKNKTNMDVRDWALMFGRTEILQFLDKNYPTEIKASRLKSLFRFIRLGFLLLKEKTTIKTE